MLTQEDLKLLKIKAISEEKLDDQIKSFQTGFPYLKVTRAATINNGIFRISDEKKDTYINEWRAYLKGSGTVLKFVPASGAASRMFKDLYEFQDSDGELPEGKVAQFFDRIAGFAFFDSLNSKCKHNEWKDISELVREKEYKRVVSNLLDEKGLNYGFLPKGLILFHKYPNDSRTPFEEHLVEGALYAKNSRGKVNLHFTVSQEHLAFFKKLLERRGSEYAYSFGTDYDVSFSVQKPSTDTVAADKDNNPFRTSDGKLLFRPGGHGALIENLNDVNADVIFIKNIDNVVPDSLKQPTVEYKVLLAGLLVSLQKQIFAYQQQLEAGSVSKEMMEEMLLFVKEKLSTFDSKGGLSETDPIEYLKNKLNRPLRVCGMVKNEGEPGGGPYLCENPDKTISLQILESSQFNPGDSGQMEIMKQATHFNPVDLVCGVCNYKGEKYDLTRYVDKNTGFISIKSKDGRELKALELPGLWNGAMSDWNTVFVEVPIETFNPVKTVNDLLRKEHQN